MKLLLDRIHDLYRQLKFNAPAKYDVTQKKLKPIKNESGILQRKFDSRESFRLVDPHFEP